MESNLMDASLTIAVQRRINYIPAVRGCVHCVHCRQQVVPDVGQAKKAVHTCDVVSNLGLFIVQPTGRCEKFDETVNPCA